nr:60s ribosomal protein l32-1 [Quercus suber]
MEVMYLACYVDLFKGRVLFVLLILGLEGCGFWDCIETMAVPLLTKKIVKKRVKQFKHPQSDRKISVKF